MALSARVIESPEEGDRESSNSFEITLAEAGEFGGEARGGTGERPEDTTAQSAEACHS